MRVGNGPILVSKLPVGIAHEFLALEPGFLPARAVVPPDAEWHRQDGELRYELALQLNDPSGSNRADELGVSRLPQALGTPTGALGTIRVVTSPPGADVYQLIGFTPEVKVQNLLVNEPLELLVYLPDHALRRVQLGAANWKPEAGGMVAEVEAKLPAKGGARHGSAAK